MPRKKSAKMRGDLSEAELKRLQANMRVYLVSYRQIEDMTREELKTRLGCSLTLLDRYEHKEFPSPVVNAISLLTLFADLKGLECDEFVASILGKTNEEGFENRYTRRIAESFSEMSADTQYKIAKFSELPEEKVNELLDLSDSYLSHTKQLRHLFKSMLELPRDWTKSILKLVELKTKEDK